MPLIEPSFEHFGDGEAWGPPSGQLKLTRNPSARVQIRNGAADRMIQVQNGRLHYNWLGKTGGPYPRYQAVKPEFDDVLRRFKEFLADENLKELRPNQWEVTYVNHLPKGTVWRSPNDWRNVLVGVPGPGPDAGFVRLESFGGECHFEIEPKLGRLHIRAGHARIGSEATEEILLLTLTARGPVSAQADEGLTLDGGLDLGREAIVKTFGEITSESAQAFWGLRDDNS